MPCSAADGHYNLGATTTRSVPGGGALGPPPEPPIRPSDCSRAFDSTVHGVCTQLLEFRSACASASDTECVTTVTPDGWPPIDIDVGLCKYSDPKFGGIGVGDSTSHLAACKTRQISCARSKHSGSSRRYMISTLAFGCP